MALVAGLVKVPIFPLINDLLFKHGETTWPRMIALSEFRETLPINLQIELNNLVIYRYEDGEFTPGEPNQTIDHLYSKIVDGSYSCLIASYFFMVTAIYYLQQRHKYVLPNVNITQLKFFC